ncbi:MAG: hypothetical protein J2P31_19485, partial [Blastocatellia bacterium]|nr:hypothetical protein [Blastocatellia bacterium]
MKRNTLILLLIALVGGVAVYFLEVKPGKSRDEAAPETSKSAFNFKREEITAMTLTRGKDKPVNLELQNNKWVIKQPI